MLLEQRKSSPKIKNIKIQIQSTVYEAMLIECVSEDTNQKTKTVDHDKLNNIWDPVNVGYHRPLIVTIDIDKPQEKLPRVPKFNFVENKLLYETEFNKLTNVDKLMELLESMDANSAMFNISRVVK